MTAVGERTQTLWVPGIEHEALAIEPSRTELSDAWFALHGRGDFLALPDEIYGVCTAPEQSPKGYAVLDLCEVLRETALGLIKLRGGTIDDMGVDDKGSVPDYGSTINGWVEEPQLQRSIHIRELMQHDLIPPVPMSGAIRAMVHQWKERGVYVVADTSTLVGCEIPTIAFLAKEYEGCFDGVLFPRNHDGLGTTTKVDAFMATKDAIDAIYGVSETDQPVVMIDDAEHHAVAFANGLSDAKVIMPEYRWNAVCESVPGIDRVTQTMGTVDAFILADQYLKGKGI